MIRANPLVRDAITMLAKHGFVSAVGDGGKHIKIRWVDAGRTFTLVVSRTPSDYRSRLRSRTILRRLLRANLRKSKWHALTSRLA
jgi:hypothetical protein